MAEGRSRDWSCGVELRKRKRAAPPALADDDQSIDAAVAPGGSGPRWIEVVEGHDGGGGGGGGGAECECGSHPDPASRESGLVSPFVAVVHWDESGGEPALLTALRRCEAAAGTDAWMAEPLSARQAFHERTRVWLTTNPSTLLLRRALRVLVRLTERRVELDDLRSIIDANLLAAVSTCAPNAG